MNGIKKIIRTILMATLIGGVFSCSIDQTQNSVSLEQSEDLSANYSGAPVKLVYAAGKTDYTYTETGLGSAHLYAAGYVRVANLAYAKKVSAWYRQSYQEWKSASANYVCTLSDSSEIWYFETEKTTYTGYNKASATYTFALKYEVNGQTYWDNNNGQDYKVGTGYYPYGYPRAAFGTDTNVFVRDSNLFYHPDNNTSYFSVNIDVKNIAYSKEVKVVFTTDNWKTVQTAAASYSYTDSFDSRLEGWFVNKEISGQVKEVKFAVSYTVNGATYWDNNFGRDYKTILK